MPTARSIHPTSIIRSSEASLLPAERRVYPDPLDDLVGFGGTLYAMLTGRAAAAEEMRLVPSKPAVLKGPSAVRAAAMRLAERCLTAERETAPDFQKVLTEVRLLHVMAKQFSPETVGMQVVPPTPPPPVLLSPPPPLEAFAGTAPPVINPPTVRAYHAFSGDCRSARARRRRERRRDRAARRNAV